MLTLNWFWRAIRVVAVLLVRAMGWRLQVEGLRHVPRRGGAVLTFNHHSYIDFVMVAWAVVLRLDRPVRFLAKREIWRSRSVGWIARLGGCVPVDREHAGSRRRALDAAVAALTGGDLVAVAPEQTISPSFELLPFRTGAVRMAQAAAVPVVPVVGWGTQRFATKGVRPRLARGIAVVVRYGEPVHVDPVDDPVAATARLQKAMEALLEEVQRGYPDGTPPGAWWLPDRLGGAAPPHEAVVRDHHQRTGGWDRDRGAGEPRA